MSSTFSTFASTIANQKYLWDLEDRKETWDELSLRVPSHVFGAVGAPPDLIRETQQLIAERKFLPGGRYLYATGRPFHQVQNCLLNRAEDSREGWSDVTDRNMMALMTGAGIGVNYSQLREEGAPIKRTGGFSTGPLSLMQIQNEAGRHIMQGGSRRAAIWAGLSWKHPDIHKFIQIKNWSKEIRKLKEDDFNFPAPMDMTNVSVCLDDEFFEAYHNPAHPKHSLALSVYWATVERMLKTGEPGFSIDIGPNAGEDLRNACTEVTSADDSDICNLGSINLARISSVSEMAHVTQVATAFLLAGTVYSDVPYNKVAMIREKNRRLGLGLMGIHEWLLTHGKKYGPDADLDRLLRIYQEASDATAIAYANKWNISHPVKKRAIAPTGTIGIIAETTTGMEPIFCAAYKRRYLKHRTWNYQYNIDSVTQKLVTAGVDPDTIEDAYSIDPERRVQFQAHLQQFVDHGISSTINLPAWGTEANNEGGVTDFGNMLIKYLPQLRGITTYPDGARGGQPLTPVRYSTAVKHLGTEYLEGVEATDICDITKGGSCGT